MCGPASEHLHKDGPWGRGYRIKYRRQDYGFGEPVGAAVAAGETAGDVCAAVVPGEDAGDDCGKAGAGEVCVAG